jgi:NAD(P)H-nitrite reductase large subunit
VNFANLPLVASCLVCESPAYFVINHRSHVDSYNEHVMTPVHHQNQDTNDRFLANIQRNGTFSVVPRIAAGEVTPDGLIAIGHVAKKYGLYTKV